MGIVINTVEGGGGGGSGSVTDVSVVAANGFDGTVANPTTTPAITLQTTITGLIRGNANALVEGAYSQSFNATTDWGSASGGFYTITIPQATHNIDAIGTLQTFEDLGSNIFANVLPDRLSFNSSTGDVSFRVTETPDGRFAGQVTITSY